MTRILTVANAEADTSAIRTETLRGREYTVVPVVALVEGVLQGANAAQPEFAPANVFGKFPSSWDGRPLVLRHPNINGIFVSANIPEVLEDYNMGFMFNTKLDGKKLKTEAWLDKGTITDLGGEFLETLERIEGGEILDVSVGCFVETVSRSGTFNGRDYAAEWESAVPDHLAILPDQKGACSVADGCGTNRVLSINAEQAAVTLRHVRAAGQEACCDDCAQSGGSCMSSATSTSTSSPSPTSLEGPNSAGQQQVGGRSENGQETASDSSAQPSTNSGTEKDGSLGAAATMSEPANSQSPSPEELIRTQTVLEGRAAAASELGVNAVASDVVFQDVYPIVSSALPERLGVESWACDVYALTTEVVVFRVYGEPNMKGFQQLRYSVASSGTVTFTGEPEPVNLMTRILPRQTALSGNSAGEPPMADQNSGVQPGNEGAGTATAPQVNEGPKGPVSLDDFLAGAPVELRGVLTSALSVHQQRKKSLVDGIKACSRNKFTEEQLNAMEVDQLEALAALADVPDYSGRAASGDAVSVNSQRQDGLGAFADADLDYLAPKPAGNGAATVQ